jgi:CheY-like chemotaxis protein
MTRPKLAALPLASTPTILVAEDDPELHELYELLLADAYRLERAYNGQQAVERYMALQPDLVLMDIKMPVLNGAVAIRRIVEIDPMANIIAVTADPRTTEELGVPILRKGFTAAEFRTRVRDALPR